MTTRPVWIVELSGYEYSRILGVASSCEKAETVVQAYLNEERLGYGDVLNIIPAVIDKPFDYVGTKTFAAEGVNQ